MKTDNAKLKEYCTGLLVSRMENARRNGPQLVGCSPLRSERRPSFSLNTEKHLYYDFGSGQSGDSIGAVMKLTGQTYKELARSIDSGATLAYVKPKGKPAKQNDAGQPAGDGVPFPEPSALYPSLCRQYGARPTEYFYRDESGRVLQVVFRWDFADKNGKKTGKAFLPASWNGKQWICKAYKRGGLSVLYGLDLLAAHNNGGAVVLAEGEKTCEAIRRAGLLALSYGNKNITATDLTPLDARQVVIMPDCELDYRDHDSGHTIKGGLSIARSLAHKKNWSCVDIDEYKKLNIKASQGMDAADLSIEQIKNLITEAINRCQK